MTALVVVVALVIAALAGAPSVARFVLALALAWLGVEVALRTRAAPRLTALARDQRGALAASALVLCVILASRAPSLAEPEGLLELAPRTRDRLRLAGAVVIAPPLFASDHPQTFFVRADGAHEVRVRLGAAEPIDAVALGHDVFRVDLDPRALGLADRAPGTITASLDVDGAHHARELAFAAPLAHLRRPRESPDHSRVCAPSEETDEIVLGRAEAPSPIDAGDGPVACDFIDASTLVVARRHDPSLLVLDASGETAGELELGLGAVALDATVGLVAVARAGEARELAIVHLAPDDPRRARSIDRLELEGIPIDVAIAADAIAVTTRSPARLELRSIDRATPRDLTRALSMPASALAVSPDGARLVIATTAFDPEGRASLGNHFVEDQLVWLDRETLAPLRLEATARRTDRQDHAGDVDRGLSPVALAFDAAGRLLVAFAGSSELAVYADDTPPRWLDLSGRAMPSGVASAGDRLAVTSAIDGALVAVDARSLEVIGLTRLAAEDRALLRDAPDRLRVRMGERSFWESTRAGASCASCHLGGASDGAAHNIGGRVLAPTLDVRGLAGTAPFLRDGSYPRLGDLHDVAALEYRGYRAPAGDRRATLDAFLASQPLPRSFAPRDVVREQRGLDAFFRARCDRCHAPPAFTTLARYPLHTVFPDHPGDPALSLDVPTLRNLREEAPYLFDGRAATLRDVIEPQNAANRHGDTRGLTDAQRADLVFFLETL